MSFSDNGAVAREGIPLPGGQRSQLYTGRERAPPELCEAMTLVADTGVAKAVRERVRASFHEYDLAQHVLATIAINAWNG